MNYSHYIARSMIDFYEKKDVQYTFNENDSFFEIPVRINWSENDYSDCKTYEFTNTILISDKGYFSYSVGDLNIDISNNNLHKIFRLVNLINFQFTKGDTRGGKYFFGLFLNPSNKELGVIQSEECGDVYLSDEKINKISEYGADSLCYFREYFLSVINNDESPDSAVNRWFDRIFKCTPNGNNENTITNDNCWDDNDDDDGCHDGWDDLNPYDLDADDYEAWMDSFD